MREFRKLSKCLCYVFDGWVKIIMFMLNIYVRNSYVGFIEIIIRIVYRLGYGNGVENFYFVEVYLRGFIWMYVR